MENTKELDVRITKVLTEIGIPANLLGFKYLRKSIHKCIDDPTLECGIVKKLYPIVATEFDTTPSRCERAMRHAIEFAFENNSDNTTIPKYFGYNTWYKKGKVCNSEFIATIADKISLDMDL